VVQLREGVEVGGNVFADGGVRAAAGFDGDDSFAVGGEEGGMLVLGVGGVRVYGALCWSVWFGFWEREREREARWLTQVVRYSGLGTRSLRA
jgi:hypothetical protein